MGTSTSSCVPIRPLSELIHPAVARFCGIVAGALAPTLQRVPVNQLIGDILRLELKTDAQRLLQHRMLELIGSSGRTRSMLANQVDHDLPMPFLALLGFWLAMLFLGF